jgi:hypothetical protein
MQPTHVGSVGSSRISPIPRRSTPPYGCQHRPVAPGSHPRVFIRLLFGRVLYFACEVNASAGEGFSNTRYTVFGWPVVVVAEVTGLVAARAGAATPSRLAPAGEIYHVRRETTHKTASETWIS